MDRRIFLLGLALAATPLLAPGSSRASEDNKKKTGGVGYLPIQALTGATNKGGGRRGVMSVECGLDIEDPALRARAQASLPRLRAAYLSTVLAYAGGLPIGALPNTDFIARTLQNQTDQILGKPGAKLLLGSVLVN